MYSATSLDQLPHMLAALQMFGSQLLMPVPDVDRTDLFICLGANPLASNGSIMTAPDMRGRLKAIQARGGRVIVSIRGAPKPPSARISTCSFGPAPTRCCCSRIVHELFASGLVRLGRLASMIRRRRRAARCRARMAAERAAAITGIAADDIRALARELAETPRRCSTAASAYARRSSAGSPRSSCTRSTR